MRNEELRMNDVLASGSTEHEAGLHAPKLRRLAGLMLAAGLISGLVGGCAMNDTQRSAEAAAYGDPQINPLPMLVRGNKTPAAYYALGKFYYFQDRLDKARIAFENALRLDPSNVDALNGLASVYDRQGKFDAAEKIYKAALKQEPNTAYVWANLGYSMILRGDKAAALYPLQQAVKIDPTNTVAQNYLARLGAESPTKVAQWDSARTTAQPTPVQQAPSKTATNDAPGNGPLPTVAAQAGPVVQPTLAENPSTPAVAEAVTAHDAVTPLATSNGTDLSRVTMVAPMNTSTVENKAVGNLASAAAPDTAAKPAPVAESNPPAPASAQAAGGNSAVSGSNYSAWSTALSGLRIEVSNGNGVEGMARAIGKDMRQAGVNVARITNAKPFNKPQTYIVCKNELQSEAARLAAVLPGKPKVVVGSTVYRRVDMWVVLGSDSALAWNQPPAKRVLVASATK